MRKSFATVLVGLASAIAALLITLPAAARNVSCPLSQVNCIVFLPLGDLPGGNFRSEVYALTPDGMVAAGLSDSAAAPASGEAFRWEGGMMEALGSLPGGSTTSSAAGIQNSSTGEWVVGASSSTQTGSSALEAFLYSGADATFTGLGSLPGGTDQSAANALAVIQPTVVVGQSSSSASGANSTEAFAFYTEDNTLTALGSLPGGLYSSSASALNAVGTIIVGSSSSAASGVNATEAFRWEDGHMEGLGFLAGGLDSSAALAINNAGSLIAGASSSAASGTNSREAFLWEEGIFTPLGDLPAGPHDSAALAISTRGIVVGRGHTEAGPRAFIWTAEAGIRDLRDVFEEASGSDLGLWQLHEATAISASGRVIAGNGLNENNLPEAWILSLPEPGAGMLTSGALACLALMARRNRHPGPSR